MSIRIENIYSLASAILFGKGKRRAVGFDLASIGELQFIEGVLNKWLKCFPSDIVVIIHHADTVNDFKRMMPELSSRVLHVSIYTARELLPGRLDMFITSEQYSKGLDGVYSVCIFHGQPSKGLTFTRDIIGSFDAFMMYGPLHRLAYERYVKRNYAAPPSHIKLFDAGYGKSDDLLSGRIDGAGLMKELSLDPSKKTILYAPAFNEYASLREYGPRIIELLSEDGRFNVIAKLPVDCLAPASNHYANGGVDWFRVLGDLQDRFPNFRLYREMKIDRALACADVLVTCVSSVSFEFMALGKPVVFVDTPLFYSRYLKGRLPFEDTESMAGDITVNAGRDYGLLVKDVSELPGAVGQAVANPELYPINKDGMREMLLYNPGAASEKTAIILDGLLRDGVRTSRPGRKTGLVATLVRRVAGAVKRRSRAAVSTALNRFGYTITRTGRGYLDAASTTKAAAAAGMGLCEYLESKDGKTGRRDRIIKTMQEHGVFESCGRVCEVGPGSGIYAEKIIHDIRPSRYEVYETDPGWAGYLRERFSARDDTVFIIHPADGCTLKQTGDNSCDLVHAHALFTYLLPLESLGYLEESARILKGGGYLVFNCLTERSFGYKAAKMYWLPSAWRFPVILPRNLLIGFAERNSFDVAVEFIEDYGPNHCEYFILRKRQDGASGQ